MYLYTGYNIYRLFCVVITLIIVLNLLNFISFIFIFLNKTQFFKEKTISSTWNRLQTNILIFN